MVGVAIAGAAVVGAGSSIIAGNKAAKAQKQAADQSAANERYFYDTTREDYAPYREVGSGALYKLADMYGVSRPIDTPPAPSTIASPQTQQASSGLAAFFGGRGVQSAPGNETAQPVQQMTPGYGGFQASPGYQFRLGEGLKAVERSAAARGLLGSGGTMKALQRYGEGLASSEYENYANALRSLAGLGQVSTAGTAAAGGQAAGGISQALTNAGNARASSYANTGAAVNNGVNNVLSAYLMGGMGGPKLPYNMNFPDYQVLS